MLLTVRGEGYFRSRIGRGAGVRNRKHISTVEVSRRDVPPEQGKDEDVSVKVPRATVERVMRRLPDSGFKTVDEYVSYVVKAVLDQVEGGGGAKRDAGSDSFTKEDEEAVEQKLKELGYL